MQVVFHNIEWDTDSGDADLPETFTCEVASDIDLELEGSDILSDEFGYCVNCFEFEIK